MSTTIDSKVVEMEFDNARFERNVRTSMNTIDELKESLNFDGAIKGFDNLDAAARGIKFNGLQNAIETVGLKFNALYSMADQAFRNITTSAMNAGKRIVSALTIDPIKMGFSEYETQINAVQTILANTESKGSTLDDVNSALDELNTYADKTIYNFTEMTRNIGTFTAAGVDLDTSVAAIKGIANLAAVSGSTSQQASTAMYQLSQALSSGTVRLMDWNSVVNAGMGGQVFQDALKETARVHGIAIDDIISKQGSFRESLSEGWLSSEILTETLSKFTGDLTEEQLKSMGYTEEQIKGIVKMGQTANDAATKVKTFSQLFDTLKEAAQSGWAQTWEIIVGDFEEAKAFLTEVSNVIGGVIGRSAEARNNVLENWKVLGGRADLLDSIRNIFEAIVSVINPIKDAFREIFPPTTSAQLVKLTKSLKDFTAKLKLSDNASNALKRTFKGLFAIVDIIRQVFVGVIRVVGGLLGVATGLGDGILSVTAIFGDMLVAFNEGIKKSKVIDKVFNGILVAVNALRNGITKLVNALRNKFAPISNMFSNFADTTQKSMDSIKSAIANCGIVKFFKNLWDVSWPIIKKVGAAIGGMVNAFGKALISDNFQGLLNLTKSLATGAIGVGLTAFIFKLTGAVKSASDAIGDFKGGALEILDGIKGIFTEIKDLVGEKKRQIMVESIKTIAIAIAILAAAVFVLSKVDPERLMDSVVGLSMLFGALIGTMAALQAITKSDLNKTKIVGKMLTLSVVVIILATALKKISGVDSERMTSSLVGLAALFAMLLTTVKILETGSKKSVKGVGQVILLTVAIKILASACKDLSVLSSGELIRGLVGVSGLLAGIAVFLKTAKFNKNSIRTATGIAILAVAIKTLAWACRDFTKMSWEDIRKGLIGVSSLIGQLVLFTRLSKSTKDILKMGTAFVLIAASMKILASVCNDLGRMSWGEIIKGLVGLSGLLGQIVIFMKLSGNSKDVLKTASSLAIMSAAIATLALSLKFMASMSWNQIAKGLAALAGSLAAVTVAVNFMPGDMLKKAGSLAIISAVMLVLAGVLRVLGNMSWESIAKGLLALGGALGILAGAMWAIKGAEGGAWSLLAITGALVVFVPVMKALGSLSWEAIIKSLTAMASTFVIFGVASKFLSSSSAAIFELSGAIAVFGLAVIAIGVGLTAVGIGITAIATGIIATVEAFKAVFGFINQISTQLVSVVSAVVTGICVGIAEGIVAFCGIIIAAAPVIGEALIVIIHTLNKVMIQTIPAVVETALTLILAILNALADYMPSISDAIFRLLIGLIQSLTRYTPPLIGAVVDFLMSIFSGVVEAIKGLSFKTLVEGSLGIGVIAGMIAAIAAVGPMIPSAMVSLVGIGLVIAELALILAALGKIEEVLGLSGLIDEGGGLLGSIGRAIGNFIGGIAGGVAEGVSAGLPGIGKNLTVFMTNAKGFIEGAKTIDASVLKGVLALVGVVTAITAAEVIDSLSSWVTGGSSIVQFGKDLAKFGPSMAQYAASISGIDAGAVTASATAAKALAEMARTIPNQGGLVSWFAGENSVAKFGKDLVKLGNGLKGFSDSAAGINSEAITTATVATSALAEMANTIPNSGGIASWFAGDNSVAKFGKHLIKLGEGLKGFSDSVSDIKADNVTSATDAARYLAEMSSVIPDSGGVKAWFTGNNSVARFGRHLAKLGEGLKGFSDSVSDIKTDKVSEATEAAKSLAEMANIIPDSGGVNAWITGNNSIARFGRHLAKLGEGLKGFSDSVADINADSVSKATDAAKALAEMANTIPESGGVEAWFTGNNSIARFGRHLVDLGTGLASFSKSVTGINAEDMTVATEVAKGIAEMTKVIPDTGGVVAWFAGDQSVAKFGKGLAELGTGLSEFSKAAKDIIVEKIGSAVGAAKGLAEMTNILPNMGGMVAWFAGDQSVAKFGGDLTALGKGLKGFSDEVAGIAPENVTAAVEAAKGLAEMASVLPNTGGLNAWFIGDESVANFADGLTNLGTGMKGFSDAVAGINVENVTAAAGAAKGLAEMAAILPKTGGWWSKIVGDNGVGDFGDTLTDLGEGMKGFSDAVAGINSENVNVAVGAAKGLAEMSNILPNTGGISAWFAGDQSVAKFGDGLVDLGRGLARFSFAASSIIPDKMTAGVDAVRSIAEMSNILPNTGGIVAWFGGDNSVASFGDGLVDLGEGLAGFSGAAANIDSDKLTVGVNAVKSIAEMSNILPNTGGIVSWFTGDKSVAKFGADLIKLGEGLAGFSGALANASTENITSGTNAAKSLAELSNTVPEDSSRLVSFAKDASKFGKHISEYFTKCSSIPIEAISNASEAISSIKKLSELNLGDLTVTADGLKELVQAIRKMSGIKSDAASGFKQAVTDICNANITAMVNNIEGSVNKMKYAGETVMMAFVGALDRSKPKVQVAAEEVIGAMIRGVNNETKTITNAFLKVVDASVIAINSKYQNFYNAGSYVASGFAAGISANSFKASAKASAMARSAANAARKELDINSPSKVFKAMGSSVPEGFALGIESMGRLVMNSTLNMSDSAMDGVKKSLSRISDVVNSDIDAQPTIRPVLDLSDVKSGADTINGMLSMQSSVGVMANVGTISSMMSMRSQNGEIHEMASAIDKLSKDIRGMDRANYNINGITYDDGSNVADAVRTLVRAAKVERRK